MVISAITIFRDPFELPAYPGKSEKWTLKRENCALDLVLVLLWWVLAVIAGSWT